MPTASTAEYRRKKASLFRLSTRTRQEICDLAKAVGLTRTAVVECSVTVATPAAIKREALRRGLL